ncbi:MAG: hypothetical protein K6G62_02285 [Eubacterium sp.]|nr:hypothetical protein [Eubacterium sp.]
MCAKCIALNSSFMGRYGAMIQAAQAGTYDSRKNYTWDQEGCEEYKKRIRQLKGEDKND